MANQYGLFWNSVSGDRVYDADSFAEWAQTFFTTGVFNGDLQVSASSGMDVTVGTGYANLEGKIRLFENSTTVTIDPASGTYPRIDTIVVQRNDTNREITIEYVKGAYSGNSPVPTAPVRAGGIYEIVLAEIYVAAGVTAITAGDITDKRADSTVCGWITGSVDSVNVAQLTTQAQAQFTAWFDAMKNQLSSDAAGNLQLEVDALAGSIATFEQSATATNSYVIGDFLIYNNQVYKVTAAISPGDTLTPGTNITATSAGAEIKQLNDDLTDINSQNTLSGESFTLIGGYSGEPGGTAKFGTFTFSQGTYKKFLLFAFLGSYTSGNCVIISERDLLNTIAVTSIFGVSVTPTWSTAVATISVVLENGDFKASYYCNNSAPNKASVQIYGITA